MDYTTMQQKILSLKQENPSLRTDVFGQTVLGRSLYRLQLGEGRKKILLAGAFHGMEHITAELLLRYGAELGKETLLSQVTIIPMMNPDGVEIQHFGWQCAGKYGALVKKASKGNTDSWQANARGVDLNHNFDADWQDLHRREMAAGILGPAATRFGGYCPESEPETRALTQLCRQEQYTAAVALHTQGEEIYWDFGDRTPRQSYDIAKSLAKASGYAVASPEGLACGGGFKDWFITEFYRPAFTIEVGKGTNPLPQCDLESMYPKVKSLLDQLIR